MPASPRRAKPQVPDSTKRILKEKADELIENVLKPEHIKPPPTDKDFNYLVDIYSKWYRNYFYFCAKYHCPSPHAIAPSFETKFARMEYMGNEKFNLAYMRHTEKWWEIYQELTMPECLKLIVEEPHFMP
ncbi:MAG TPA: hypothetical protein DIW77_16900 [Chromatiaceae bacterium]|nr:hypothetical protein [Chromatiaceae bacterium]